MTPLSAPAKINLGLRVLRRRADGYHEIESLFLPLDLADEIRLAVEPALHASVRLSLAPTPLSVPYGDENLAARAARAFLEAAGLSCRVDIELAKHTPVAAGLGGGSSDAGAVLRGLAAQFPEALDDEALASLALALLLNRTILGAGFFRTAFFLPVITSTIAIAVVWLWVYDDNNGLLNLILRGLGFQPVRWLTSSKTALLSVIIMNVWRNSGYHMVIFLAGLQSIPETLYEAATIDGVNTFQRFRYITWPLLVPTTVFVLITNTIFTFQVFGPIYVMTGGGPARSTSVIVYYLYQRAFEFQEMGYASAVAWIIFIILIGLTLFQLWLSRNKEKIW